MLIQYVKRVSYTLMFHRQTMFINIANIVIFHSAAKQIAANLDGSPLCVCQYLYCLSRLLSVSPDTLSSYSPKPLSTGQANDEVMLIFTASVVTLSVSNMRL